MKNIFEQDAIDEISRRLETRIREIVKEELAQSANQDAVKKDNKDKGRGG